ncbi:MAG: 6-phosphofructokinase [Bacteroidota bacterium]
MTEIKRIGVLTSGGDAPGMNAAIRAVVRACAFNKVESYGIYRGYQGMIENDIVQLNPRKVGNILHKGGTMLKSARCLEFKTEEGMQKAYENLMNLRIDALVVIGGDGSFTGGLRFAEKYNFPVIGIPGTIDNDLGGTDYTLGFDTATNTVIDAVDKIRDTALSHNRLFFVEVMGRDSGFIAASAALASGAKAVMVPEKKVSMKQLMAKLKESRESGKSSSIVVVAEGGKSGNAYEIAKEVQEKGEGYDTKVTVLGHIQRGGNPSVKDRLLACNLGVAAVNGLLDGKSRVMCGEINNQVVYTSIKEAITQKLKVDNRLLELAEILSI